MRHLIRWLFLVCLAAPVFAKDVVVVELLGFRRYDFAHESVQVTRNVEVKIEVWGASDRWENDMLAYGWILDAETREVVWEMTFRNSHRERHRYLRKSEESIRLREGEYEVFYAIAPRGDWTGNYRDVGDFFDDLHAKVEMAKGYVHTWDGELYLEHHRGTLTTQSKHEDDQLIH